ncbi:hypothetical protein MXB_3626, partial [Myxobolus squamalis]
IAAIIIPSETFDVELEFFLNNFLHEKALCLDLYPQKIYQILLLRWREKYSSQPYRIPSKRKIYGIIRELRGLMFANSILAAQLPPLKHLSNGTPFFRGYWFGDFDGEFHQMLLWSTNEALVYILMGTVSIHTIFDYHGVRYRNPNVHSMCLCFSDV